MLTLNVYIPDVLIAPMLAVFAYLVIKSMIELLPF